MKRRAALLFMAAVFLAASCDEGGSLYESQLMDIQKYIDAQVAANPEYTVTGFTGAVRLTIQQGEGESVGAGGLVKMYYTGSIFTNTIGATFASNEPSDVQWTVSGEDRKEPVVVDLSDKDLIKGLKTGLVGVRPGEVCYIIFPADLGMGNRSAGTIPAGSALAYKITVLDIEND